MLWDVSSCPPLPSTLDVSVMSSTKFLKSYFVDVFLGGYILVAVITNPVKLISLSGMQWLYRYLLTPCYGLVPPPPLPLTFNKLIFSLVFFTAGHLHFPVFQAVVYSLRFNIAQSFTSHPTLLGFLSICVTCGIPYEQKFPLLLLLDDTDSSTHSCHPGYSFSTLR